jgi:hypothetical protein
MYGYTEIVKDVVKYRGCSLLKTSVLDSEALLCFEVSRADFQNRAQKSAHPAALGAIIVVNIVVGDGDPDKY